MCNLETLILIFLELETETFHCYMCVWLRFKEHPVQWFFSLIIQKHWFRKLQINPTYAQTNPELNAQTRQAQFALHMHILQREDAAFSIRKKARSVDTFWV